MKICLWFSGQKRWWWFSGQIRRKIWRKIMRKRWWWFSGEIRRVSSGLLKGPSQMAKLPRCFSPSKVHHVSFTICTIFTMCTISNISPSKLHHKCIMYNMRNFQCFSVHISHIMQNVHIARVTFVNFTPSKLPLHCMAQFCRRPLVLKFVQRKILNQNKLCPQELRDGAQTKTHGKEWERV